MKTGGSAPEGTVRDAPAKPQRGLNLDIARKFFTPDWIEDRLREMADLKLNQLGLHFSDDQAFRIESASHPEIVSTPHLTKAQVREINALAARLHITVVPEIDSPGHLGAVLRAHPDLQLRDVQGRAVKGAVDISNPASAKLVDDLLREYQPLFLGGAWHLGADEYQALVYRDPQSSFPRLASAARQRYRAVGAGPGPRDGLAERPRGRGPAVGQGAQGVERRLLRGRRDERGEGHPGRVLDGQGERRPAAAGVPEGGPQGRQPQRRVPLLRARPAQPVHVPHRQADLRTVDPAGAARDHPGARGVRGPDPGRAARRLERPGRGTDPGPGRSRHPAPAGGAVPEGLGRAPRSSPGRSSKDSRTGSRAGPHPATRWS
ncbi:hypothetical protein GCM10020254_13830 [Streptomyces goshikiensis]